jgi:hypothetical protein
MLQMATRLSAIMVTLTGVSGQLVALTSEFQRNRDFIVAWCDLLETGASISQQQRYRGVQVQQSQSQQQQQAE